MNLWQQTWRLWRKHPRERAKLVLGWLFYRRATQQWLSYLRADPLLWDQVAEFPKLVTRIYRPYALRGLSCRERVAHMVQHHDLLRQQGLRALLERSAQEPLTMLKLPVKGEGAAEVRLQSLHDGHREGETHLQFYWNGEWLYSLSFLLRSRQDRLQMLITRLQGSNQGASRDWIRQATKGMHGCRPTVMLEQLARQLAQTAGCQEVLLVSHRMRVALNPMRRLRIKTDLEALWAELGAEVDAQGFFRLSPVVEVAQDFSAVASNKRAEARRKAELIGQSLRELDAQLRACQA